jgi:hypothetical protein
MPEFDEPEIKDKQQYVQENYSKLRDSRDAAVGQFKTAIPFEDGQIGVVVMSRSASAYNTAEKMMENEKSYLEFLNKSELTQVSPLKTYGEVFKVSDSGKEYPAMLVDWIPSATLIDSKDPKSYRLLLSGIAMNVKIPSQQEAWPMKLALMKENIDSLSEQELLRAQMIAEQILKKISDFQQELQDKQIKIADLQLMITVDENDNLQLTIIDPVAVLEKSKEESFYEDILDRGKKADDNPDFQQFLSNTNSMLMNMTKWSQDFILSDNKKEFLKQSIEPPKIEDKKPSIKAGPLTAGHVAQMLLKTPGRRVPALSVSNRTQHEGRTFNVTSKTIPESINEPSPGGDTKKKKGPGSF